MGAMIPAQVKALQDEVATLMATVDALEATCERQKALLREALAWVPQVDLGERIAAALMGTPS
jgi:hypothetical protein